MRRIPDKITPLHYYVRIRPYFPNPYTEVLAGMLKCLIMLSAINHNWWLISLNSFGRKKNQIWWRWVHGSVIVSSLNIVPLNVFSTRLRTKVISVAFRRRISIGSSTFIILDGLRCTVWGLSWINGTWSALTHFHEVREQTKANCICLCSNASISTSALSLSINLFVPFQNKACSRMLWIWSLND